MLELGKKERHLTGGLVLQMVVVALLVFAFTQAARYLSAQKEKAATLSEQVAAAQSEVSKMRGVLPDLDKIRRDGERMESRMAGPETLAQWAALLEKFGKEQFSILEAKIEVGIPEKTMKLELQGRPPVEVNLVPVTMQGMSSARSLAAFLGATGQLGMDILAPLQSVELENKDVSQPLPVRFKVKWLAAVATPPPAQKPELAIPASAAFNGAQAARKLAWGPREEPFQYALDSPRAYKGPASAAKNLHLSGILWDQKAPTCVVNGNVLRPGDSFKEYKVVLITQKAVVMDSPEGEAVLFLP